MGINVNINYTSVKSGICQEELSSHGQELYWRVICCCDALENKGCGGEETNVHS